MKRCTSRMLTAWSSVRRRQRLSQGCWQTRPVEAGQRVVHHHRFEGVFQPPFLVELEEARDVHVQRAAVLAGRERQVVADAGAAAAARGCGPRTRGGNAAWW